MSKTVSKSNGTVATANSVSLVIPKSKDCSQVVKFEFTETVLEALKASNQMPIMRNAYVAKGVPGIATATAVRITIEAIQ